MLDDTQSDIELIRRIRAGDKSAADRLVNRYLRAARALALAYVSDTETADDVSQDAIIQALVKIDECRHPARFGAWLARIVRNCSLNTIRQRRTARNAGIQVATEHSESTSQACGAEQAEARDRLIGALHSLSEIRRAVVLLHDLEGWTHDEIAVMLEIPTGTVRSHLHYARRRLRSILEADYGDL